MKEAKFEAVAQAVLSTLANQGVSAVSHSRISRLAKVSRPWIYKYVGNTKKNLIEHALSSFGESLVALGGNVPDSDPEQLKKHFLKTTWLIFDFAKKHPDVIQLYYRFNGSQNAIGQAISRFEEQVLNQHSAAIAKTFGISKAEAKLVAEMMITFRMGVCFRFAQSKLSDRADQKQIEKAIKRFIKHTGDILARN